MAMVFNEIQNVNANFKEVDVESLLYSAAKAYNVSEFEQLMCNIDCVEECLRTYLLRVGYEKWAHVLFYWQEVQDHDYGYC